MYTNLYFAKEVHQISSGAENRSLLKRTQIAPGLTVTQKLGCVFVDELNPASKMTQQLSYRKTTQHLGKKYIKNNPIIWPNKLNTAFG